MERFLRILEALLINNWWKTVQFYFVDELVHFVFSFTLHLYYVAQGAVLASHLNPFDDVG